MKLITVMKTIVLLGVHGNRGVFALLNVKKMGLMTQLKHDSDAGIPKRAMGKSALVVNKYQAQEKYAVEMQVMFAIKNKPKAVMKMSNVLLNANGLNGLNGAFALLRVKTA